jgi:hypothetical protein
MFGITGLTVVFFVSATNFAAKRTITSKYMRNPDNLMPHSLQMTPLIYLNGGASVSQVVRIVNKCAVLHLGEAMNISGISAALAPSDPASANLGEPNINGDHRISRAAPAEGMRDRSKPFVTPPKSGFEAV